MFKLPETVIHKDFEGYQATLEIDLLGTDFGDHLTVRPGGSFKKIYQAYIPDEGIDKLEKLQGWAFSKGGALAGDHFEVTPELREWVKQTKAAAEAFSERYAAPLL